MTAPVLLFHPPGRIERQDLELVHKAVHEGSAALLAEVEVLYGGTFDPALLRARVLIREKRAFAEVAGVLSVHVSSAT